MICYRDRISRKAAEEKIFAHAVAGSMGLKPATLERVREYFAKEGREFDEAAELCRDYRKVVPLVENLVGSTWTVASSGAGSSVSAIGPDGREVGSVSGSGFLTTSAYLARFEEACEARDRAVQKNSYPALHTAVMNGVAALEGFLNFLADCWNARKPGETLGDSKAGKVSFDEKIDVWFPKITGGKLDKSDRRWNDFVQLARMRDDYAAHPKASAYGVSEEELAEKINLFRSGIAGLLARLHVFAGVQVPGTIINAVFMPDAEVVV